MSPDIQNPGWHQQSVYFFVTFIIVRELVGWSSAACSVRAPLAAVFVLMH